MDEKAQRIGTLRGASVSVNTRMAARVAALIATVGLATLAVGLIIAGAHRNSQVAVLKDHGVAVTVKVTNCIGLLGGSGSNAAGYQCTGIFELGAHRYSEVVPDTNFYAPGTNVKEIAAPGSPPLLATPAAVASDRVTNRVFIAPVAILVSLFVGLMVVLLARQGSRTRRRVKESG